MDGITLVDADINYCTVDDTYVIKRLPIMMCMDIDLIIGIVVVAFFGLEIFALNQYGKEKKAKTGRFFPSWGSMSTLRKANTVGLIILFLAMMYWLYNYSILAP